MISHERIMLWQAQGVYVHPTAIIDEDVDIGKGTKVWAYSHISQGAVIGKSCVIGEGVHIGQLVTIGDNCKIQNHALIYKGVEIGNRVFIGPNVVTTNDRDPQATGNWMERFRSTYIEDDVSIGANSTILCGITLARGCRIGCGALVTKSCLPWRRYYNPATVALEMHELATPTTGTIRVEP